MSPTAVTEEMILITEPPSIVKAELVIVTSRKNTKYLNCETTGSPAATITWTSIPSGQVIATDRGLILRARVNNSDDGALYQCTASNPLGNVSMSASVTMHAGEHCNNLSLRMPV